MTRRVPTVRELRELMAEEEAALEEENATRRGERAFTAIQAEAKELAARCRLVKRPVDEWVMLLRLAAFDLEEKAHPHRMGKVRRR